MILIPEGETMSGKVEEYNLFCCLTCGDGRTMNLKEMQGHLLSKHNINAKTTPGQRQALMHMDGDDWYSWEYEWNIGGINLRQSIMRKRDLEG